MIALQRGRYRARLAVGARDTERALALRGLAFRGGGTDVDRFDARCDHVLIEDMGQAGDAGARGALRCCFRMQRLESGAEIGGSYAAQFYDLSALAAFPGPMVELGRFCLHPAYHDPDVLRLAWGALAAYVDAEGIGVLFGCASFEGTDPAAYEAAFSMLGARHLAPERWRPAIGSAEVFGFGALCAGAEIDLRRGLAQTPPLLRTYLGMGGWVSDHAVIDRDMNTLHVFTAVEIASIPEARKRLLRAVAR